VISAVTFRKSKRDSRREAEKAYAQQRQKGPASPRMLVRIGLRLNGARTMPAE
jgi:hypothetical protein